jgi:chemotaxis protein histidine kinase CheA/CheY-like chemotaxis protein
MQPEQKQRIMGFFIEEAQEHLNTIEQGLLNLPSTIEDSEQVNELFRAAHSIKGGAAMLGLNSIQIIAHRLEDYFKILKENLIVADQKLESLFLQVFDQLKALLEHLVENAGELNEPVEAQHLAQAEPAFAALKTYLEELSAHSPPRPSVSALSRMVPKLVETVTSGKAMERERQTPKSGFNQSEHPEQSALQLIFQSDVSAQLREMLQFLKQPDTPQSRQRLQEIARSLRIAGEQFELKPWCEFVEVAAKVLANPAQDYLTIAPILIKQFKQAQELVLAGRSAEIAVSEELKALQSAATVAKQSEEHRPSVAILGDKTSPLRGPLVTTHPSIDPPIQSEAKTVKSKAQGGNHHPHDKPKDVSQRKSETPVNRRAGHTGPEVGMAELNSLADLFDGEAPDLDTTWEAEEIIELNSEENLTDIYGETLTQASVVSDSDFADLLFEENAFSEETNPVDDLNSLFGDALVDDEQWLSLSAPNTSSQPKGSPPSNVVDENLSFEGLDLETPTPESFPASSQASPEAENLEALFAGLDEKETMFANQPNRDHSLPNDSENLNDLFAETDLDAGTKLPSEKISSDEWESLWQDDIDAGTAPTSPEPMGTLEELSTDDDLSDLLAITEDEVAQSETVSNDETSLDSWLDGLDLDLIDEETPASSPSKGLSQLTPEGVENGVSASDFDWLGLETEPAAQNSGVEEMSMPEIESLDVDLDNDFNNLFDLAEPEVTQAPVENFQEETFELFASEPASNQPAAVSPTSEFDLDLEFSEQDDLEALLAQTAGDEDTALSELDALLFDQPAETTHVDLEIGNDLELDLDELFTETASEISPPATTPAAQDEFDFDSLFDTLEEPDNGVSAPPPPVPVVEVAPPDLTQKAATNGKRDTEFADLEAMLDETLSVIQVQSQDQATLFFELEALLETPKAPPPEPAPTPVFIEPLVAPKSSIPDSEFDELESLLQAFEPPKPRPGVASAKSRQKPFLEQTMRVPIKQLDNLSNLVGELVVNRNSLEQDQERLRQFLDNLLHQVQQLSDVGQRMQDLYERSLLEISLLSSRQNAQNRNNNSRDSHTTGASFDALEMDRFTGFHTLSQEIIELIVRVRESAADIEFLVDETEQVTRQLRQVSNQLQEGLTRARMVPFSTLERIFPLARAVRDKAIEHGKQAEVRLEGRETMLDKLILEHLSDPLKHLINNAIAHGIEAPEIREKWGKTPVGRITIRAFHQGNQTVLSFSDDGAGIDTENVKRKAIEKGLIKPAEAEKMSRPDVYELLFHPGFSTMEKANMTAGRGVGMDVVRSDLSEIRGVITIDSTLGKGTTFTIRLPLTLSISKALCCISDRARIAFPMDGVEDMLDVPRDRVQTNAEGQTCIPWRDTTLPFKHLRDLLVYNRHLGRGSVYGSNAEDDVISVVVLRSAGNYLALQVDQVLGEQEIVIKQLEGPVPKPIGVAGATVMGDGRIVAIADVLELIDLAAGRLRRESGGSLLWDEGAAQIPQEIEHKMEPTVLIVDDSITVRELLSLTFNKAGYRVEQARDGQEAWEKLRSGLPCDIVFCDIEMPRMDGLELLSRMQKDSILCDLPIAMLTSRGADRHRQMAVSLGARGYFTKPYLEEVLLEAASRMLKGEVLVTSKAEA